jgi:hypothetical protein
MPKKTLKGLKEELQKMTPAELLVPKPVRDVAKAAKKKHEEMYPRPKKKSEKGALGRVKK